MATIIINDHVREAMNGETVLDIGQRYAEHIGFVCGANGICTTCEVRVLSGADQLSPVSTVERSWLPPSRLERGHRLGCQAVLESLPGGVPVSVISRIEELKRQAFGILNPPPQSNSIASGIELLTNLTVITGEHLIAAPTGLLNSVSRLGVAKFLFPWNNVDAWVRNGQRVIEHELDYDPARATVEDGLDLDDDPMVRVRVEEVLDPMAEPTVRIPVEEESAPDTQPNVNIRPNEL